MRWLFFALHAGMHNREHIPLSCPGLLIRRSGYYMAASSVSILVCIKHRTTPYDRRTSTRYGNRLQHARLFDFLVSETHHSGRPVLATHIFSFLQFFFSDVTMRVFLFACSFSIYPPHPLFRDLVFLMWLMLSQASLSFSLRLSTSDELSWSKFGMSALTPLVCCLAS